jgi:superfamily I DNA/RNA helicase
MARLLPDDPVGLLSPEAMKAYRLCRELPDGWVVWQNLSNMDADGALFWIARESDWRSLLLVVSQASAEDAQGPTLFADDAVDSFGVAEARRLMRLRKAYQGTAVEASQVLLFPNVMQEHLAGHGLTAPFGGREVCRPKGFEAWVVAHLGPETNPDGIQVIREIFCPETVIPTTHTVRPKNAESVVPALLTYRQEELLKTDLDLSPEGRRAAGQFGLLLINGVAGSGKSLILLHRTLLLQRFFPRSRLLVLTCNKPLQMELRRRHGELGGIDHGIEWMTFHGFCLKHWPGEAPKMGERLRIRKIIEGLLLPYAREGLERKHLEAEFTWIFEQGFADMDAYQAQTRKGRGFRCNDLLRERLWRSAQEFRRQLESEGLSDWGLLPLQLLERYRQDGVPLPCYDAVLVDEAQFFAPVWFEVVRKVLSPEGHLFLVADPTQGFLQRGGSWKSQGLQVHGRTRKLERSHRTTRSILDVAWKFWNARTRREDPDIVVPKTEGMPEGEAPRLVRFETPHAEMEWVTKEVVSFVKAGGDPRHVLILHEDWQTVQDLVARLRELMDGVAVEDAREATGKAVRVCSLNSATGLESPVVFVAGTHLLFGKEGALLSDAESRDVAAQETTRKLYMAFTRAGQRLVVTHAGEPPKSLLAAFG